MTNASRLFLATNNKGKIIEIQSALQHLAVALVKPSDLDLKINVLEDGKTYAENAIKKALAFAEVSNLVTLADDSGLEVDGLNGAPGIRSARYSPLANATDKDRREFLLSKLIEKPRPWTARFRATLAIASPGGNVQLVEASCNGEIIPKERGISGFGYDPIFQVIDTGRTMAELNIEEKNRFSHRGQAIRKALPILIALFKL